MQETKFIEKYFFIGLLIMAIVLVFAILSPFITTLVMGIATSVVVYPIYKTFSKILPEKTNWISSLLTIILFVAILWVPFVFLGSLAYRQLFDLYYSFDISGGSPVIDTLNEIINTYMPIGFDLDLQSEVTKLISYLFDNISNLFTATLNTIFLFTLIVLTMFYTLKEGSSWRRLFIKMSPLEQDHNEKILDTLSSTINGIIKGYFIVAIIQGVLMGVGLYIFNVPNPILWGVVAAIMSLVPTIGTSLVSIPAIIYLAINGTPFDVTGMIIWAVAIVGMVDNLVNPLIVGKKTNLPPIIILFSVLGGIALMGPLGILIGPLSVSLLRVLFIIYKQEVKE